MEVVAHDNSGHFAFRGTCPYKECNRPSVFSPIQSTNAGVNRTTPQGQLIIRWVAVLQCQGCRKYVLGLVDQVHNQPRYVYLEHYPVGSPDDTVSEHVPAEIRTAFQEALRSRWVNAHQATVLMCRRSLQISCDMELKEEAQVQTFKTPEEEAAWKKKNQRKDLFEKIDELAAQQRITEPLKKMAHRIRLLGKRGAHGDYSDIDATITPADADEAILFMRHYLEHVYILPAKLNPAPLNPSPTASGSVTPTM